MYAIGVMPMPAGFKYRDVFLKGKPRHDRYDSFRIRHPEMPPGKRAKLFAPFDALRGFDFAILMKNEIYTDKAYYEACSDVNSEAYGSQGQYKTVTGICWNVDAKVTKTIQLDGMRIRMEDIREIQSPEKLFETRWEDQSSDWDT